MGDFKPTDAKTTDTKTTDAKPTEAKSADAKTSDHKAFDNKSTQPMARPQEAKPDGRATTGDMPDKAKWPTGVADQETEQHEMKDADSPSVIQERSKQAPEKRPTI